MIDSWFCTFNWIFLFISVICNVHSSTGSFYVWGILSLLSGSWKALIFSKFRYNDGLTKILFMNVLLKENIALWGVADSEVNLLQVRRQFQPFGGFYFCLKENYMKSLLQILLCCLLSFIAIDNLLVIQIGLQIWQMGIMECSYLLSNLKLYLWGQELVKGFLVSAV